MDSSLRSLLDAIEGGRSDEECVSLACRVSWDRVSLDMGDDHPLLWAVGFGRVRLSRLLLEIVDVDDIEPSVQGAALNASVQYFDACGRYEDTDAMLRLLLDAGFDPLASLGGGHTALRETLLRGCYPEKYKLMLDAVWPRFANKKRGSALSCRSKKKNLDPSVDRGVMPFARRWVMEGTPRWELLLGRCDHVALARAIAKREGYALHENAEKTLVRVEVEQLFVYGLVGMPWSIAMQRVGSSYAPSSERLRATAAGVSKQEELEILWFCNPEVERFVDGDVVEHQDWSIEAASAEAFHGTDVGIDSLEDRLNEQMDAWFAQHDILVPSMGWDSEGVFSKLVLRGLKKSQVNGLCVLDVKTLDHAAAERAARRDAERS